MSPRTFWLAAGLGLAIVGPLRAQVGDPNSIGPLASQLKAARSTGDLGEVFVAANSAYDSGDYETAIDYYRELIELGVAGGKVHFNLGNAYLRNGELGRAVAELRRARNLLPRDEDIRANLLFARQSTKDAIAPPEPAPVYATVFFWHYRLSVLELAGLAVVLSVAFWSLALIRLYRSESEILSWILIAVLVVLLGTLGSLIGHRFFSRPVAVVMPQEIDAFTAPDVDSIVRFKLHAGTEVRIRDQREGWIRIILPDAQQGWIETSWIERVES